MLPTGLLELGDSGVGSCRGELIVVLVDVDVSAAGGGASLAQRTTPTLHSERRVAMRADPCRDPVRARDRGSCRVHIEVINVKSTNKPLTQLQVVNAVRETLGIDPVDNLKLQGCIIADAGIVDNVDKAHKAGEYFRSENVSAIFLYITTYALSSTVLPVVQHAGVPLIVLNLQPEKSIDYEKFNAIGDRGIMTGEWLAYCQSCVVPEIASVLSRAGIKFNLITGFLEEQYVWDEVSQWMQAIKVVNGMQHNRVGVMGHYYNGMLDV